jgi:hypothetical protein
LAQARANWGEDLSISLVKRRLEKSAFSAEAPPALLAVVDTRCKISMLQSLISIQPLCLVSVLSPSMPFNCINPSNAIGGDLFF